MSSFTQRACPAFLCACADTVCDQAVLKKVNLKKKDFWNKQLSLNLALSKPTKHTVLKHLVASGTCEQALQ